MHFIVYTVKVVPSREKKTYSPGILCYVWHVLESNAVSTDSILFSLDASSTFA